jgi:hypothetical protein
MSYFEPTGGASHLSGKLVYRQHTVLKELRTCRHSMLGRIQENAM